MKYSAHYKMTDTIRSSILAAAQDMCSSDRYYPKRCDNTHRFGVGIYGRVPANWQELVQLTSADMVVDHATLREHRNILRWKTCGGNVEGIIISGDVVIYIREGRRHGIPNWFREIFEGLVPMWGTDNYVSRRTDVSPFEKNV